jgi:hypothetical protein
MASRNKVAALLLCFLFLAAVVASAAEVCMHHCSAALDVSCLFPLAMHFISFVSLCLLHRYVPALHCMHRSQCNRQSWRSSPAAMVKVKSWRKAAAMAATSTR